MIEYQDPITDNLVLSYLESRGGRYYGLQCRATSDCEPYAIMKLKKIFQRTIAFMKDRGTLPEVTGNMEPICHGFTEEELNA